MDLRDQIVDVVGTHAYLPVPEGARSVDDDRFFACLAGDLKWCTSAGSAPALGERSM